MESICIPATVFPASLVTTVKRTKMIASATHVMNGGTCVDGVNAYTCSCVDGFFGNNCETNVDDCARDPCENGGTCVDGVNTYTCSCVDGFFGDHCETNVDDCTGDPCKNGGTCIDGVNTYTCSCPVGFSGNNCTVSDPTPALVAVATPSPILPPTMAPVVETANLGEADLLPNPLLVGMDGGSRQDGVMFDTYATVHTHVVEFEINCYSTKEEHFELYTRKGGFKGYNRKKSEWDKHCDGKVQCQGPGSLTKIPAGICGEAIEIEAGEVQAFYITATTGAVVDYTSTKQREGTVVAENECLAVMVGKGVKYPFKRSYKKRRLNGLVNVLCRTLKTGGTIYPQGAPQSQDPSAKSEKSKKKEKKKKKNKNKAKFMPVDGMSDSDCEDFDDCDNDMECIDGRCEVRIGFDGHSGAGTNECGTEGAPCSYGTDCCSSYNCVKVNGKATDMRCKLREDVV